MPDKPPKGSDPRLYSENDDPIDRPHTRGKVPEDTDVSAISLTTAYFQDLTAGLQKSCD